MSNKWFFKAIMMFCFILDRFLSRIMQPWRRWIGVVDGHNTSCKAHKVCTSLWPMGWDDVGWDGMGWTDRVAILNWQVKRFGGSFASTVLWYNFVLTSKHIEEKLYTDIDKHTRTHDRTRVHRKSIVGVDAHVRRAVWGTLACHERKSWNICEILVKERKEDW